MTAKPSTGPMRTLTYLPAAAPAAGAALLGRHTVQIITEKRSPNAHPGQAHYPKSGA